MSLQPLTKPLGLAAAILMGAACGTAAPSELEPGDTAIVLSLNPRINDASQVGLPLPGPERSGARVGLEPGPSAITDARGLAVLANLEAGPATLHVGERSLSGLQIREGELRDVAVAGGDAELQLMADVRYRFRGAGVVELDDSTSLEQLNEALTQSNRLVRVRGGRFHGDLVIDGSNVTLFGEGSRGAQTTVTGNVTLNGSSTRIRGVRIEGDLVINGSNVTITFSEVTGAVRVVGSHTVMLENDLCQGMQVSGVHNLFLENRGAAPLAPPTEGC